MAFRKFINDPVYGFITIDDPLIFRLIGHPWYQRLRRIKQMALSDLVYPGAVHSRMHHSLGAYHLMCLALNELKNKGTAIEPEEEQGAKIAILLHDMGHGPFSHALESELIEGIDHEELSLRIMHALNQEMDGALSVAIDIFEDKHPQKFLHQLVSGQLDVDRMDYLTRDSYFSGVTEGVIGYDRILKMLVVHEGELMVEEKGIYSIEEFLVSRRLMYWQVYLHKTVVAAEMMLVKIFQRARQVAGIGGSHQGEASFLEQLVFGERDLGSPLPLDRFCQLDDTDVVGAIKKWSLHPDPVLSFLCTSVLNRNLFKVKLQHDPIPTEMIASKKMALAVMKEIPPADRDFLVFTGEVSSRFYNPVEEKIQILFKDGTVRDISQVENPLVLQKLTEPIKKFYLCFHSPQHPNQVI